jgi:hypothetical protein
MAYNARTKSQGGQQAFCMPANLVLTVEQAEDIMLRRADKTAAKGDTLVSILLLADCGIRIRAKSLSPDRRLTGACSRSAEDSGYFL